MPVMSALPPSSENPSGNPSANPLPNQPTGRPRRRLGVFVVILAVVLAYEAYAFFIKEAGEAENIASASDWHLTGEVAGAIVLDQGLVPHADGFDGLDVWAHATGVVPDGPVRFTITQNIGNGQETLAQVSYPARDVVSTRPFHVTIPRIDLSAGRQYTVHIAAPAATAGHGLRFEASGPAYPQGAMTLGGREEWGDLQFRTSAERTTIYRNVRHLRQTGPAFARSDLFLAIMFLLFNVALATLLYDLACGRDDEISA
jgi:hypothetical protein